MGSQEVVVAIVQAKEEPWESIWREGQVPTWIDRYKNQYEIVNVSGLPMGRLWKQFDSFHEVNRYSTNYGRLQGRLDYVFIPWLNRNIPKWKQLPNSVVEEIRIITNSSYVFAGRRLLGTLKWFIQSKKSNFIYLTTTSSLINVRLLEEKIADFDVENPLYAGQVLGDSNLKFVSGAGTLMNRRAVEIVLDNCKLYPHQMLNDAALGYLLRDLKVIPVDLPWCWLTSSEEIYQTELSIYRQTIHYRLKTNSSPRSDSKVMVDLHKHLLNLFQMRAITY